jgi:hypothetical protein
MPLTQQEILALPHRIGLNMEELEYRKSIILNLISNCDIHINVLEEDILKNPNSNIEGKTPRTEVLQDFYNQKNLLEQELSDINQLIN